jgi:hypothetical protein
MKKTILAAVVLFAMSDAAQAQLVKFGIKGRVNCQQKVLISNGCYNNITGLVAEVKLTDGFSTT